MSAKLELRVVVLFGVLLILAVLGSRKPVIYDETEGQYAGAAREMIERGDWIIPSNNGVPRFQKPPLLYWVMIPSMKVFGVNEFAARLPNALATWGWLVAVYLLGRRVGGETMGLLSVIMLAGACGFFVFTHVIMPEPLLGLFITLTIWSFLRAWDDGKEGKDRRVSQRWLTWAWVFMALGSMSKGLHGAAWPLATAGVTALLIPWTRPFWKELIQWRGILLFFLILCPWYLAVEWKFAGFIWDQLVNEQIGHALDQRWPPSSNQVEMGVYLIQHLFMMSPPMLFLPAAIRAWLTYRKNRSPEEGRRFAHRLLIIWFTVTFVTTLFSARQDYYTMSSWGAMAVFLATPWMTRVQINRWFFLGPFLLLLLVGLFLTGGGIWLGMQDESMTISVVPIVERDHLWNALNGFSLGAWRSFAPLMITTGVSLFVGSGVGLFLGARGNWQRAGFAFGASMILPYLMAVEGFSTKQDYFSLQNTAEFINENAPEAAIVVYSGYPNLASSLFFYLDRQVHWVGAPVDYEYATRDHGIGEELYLDAGDVSALWASEQPVYLITEESELPDWSGRFQQPEDSFNILSRSGTRVLIANRSP